MKGFETPPRPHHDEEDRPDISIDLTAPDAIERLERLQDTLEPTTGPEDVSEASEEVTPEDEAELEAALAESDSGRETHAIQACQDAAEHLFHLQAVGHPKAAIERAARREAEKIAEAEKKKPIRESERMTADEALKRIKEDLALYIESHRSHKGPPESTD